MSKWTPQDLENIATLAKLHIQPKDVDARLREFTDILSHIEVLDAFTLPEDTNPPTESLRMVEDQPRESFPIEDVLKNAHQADSPFFFIPKFIEGGKS